MSMSSNIQSHRSANRLSGFVGAVSQRYTRYKTYRTTLDELEALSDRDLADLGIARSMIRSIAYQAAYGG